MVRFNGTQEQGGAVVDLPPLTLRVRAVLPFGPGGLAVLALCLLGAGGGGYSLFLSETMEQGNRLRVALGKLSAYSPSARLVDFSLHRAGLQVSVS